MSVTPRLFLAVLCVVFAGRSALCDAPTPSLSVPHQVLEAATRLSSRYVDGSVQGGDDHFHVLILGDTAVFDLYLPEHASRAARLRGARCFPRLPGIGVAPTPSPRDALLDFSQGDEHVQARDLWVIGLHTNRGLPVAHRVAHVGQATRDGSSFHSLLVKTDALAGTCVVVDRAGRAVGITCLIPRIGKRGALGLLYELGRMRSALASSSMTAVTTQRAGSGKWQALAAASPELAPAKEAVYYAIQCLTCTDGTHPWFVSSVRQVARLYATIHGTQAAYDLLFREIDVYRLEAARGIAELRLVEAQLLNELGRAAEAEDLIRSVLDQTGTEWGSRLLLLEMHLDQEFGSSNGTRPLPEGVLPLPDVPCPDDLRNLMGAALAGFGQLELALPLLAPSSQPSTDAAYYAWLRGRALVAAGHGPEGRDALRLAVRDADAPASWFSDLASVLCALGGPWQEADAALDVCFREIEPTAEMYEYRAGARLHLGDPPGAHAAIVAHLRLAPESAMGWFLYGRIAQARLHDEDLALALRKLDEIRPEYAARLRKLARTR